MNVKKSQLSISIEQSMKRERRTKEHTRTPNPFETSGYAFPSLVWYSLEQKQAPGLFRTALLQSLLVHISIAFTLISSHSSPLFLSLTCFRVFRQFGNAGAPMLLFLLQQVLGISPLIINHLAASPLRSDNITIVRGLQSRTNTFCKYAVKTPASKDSSWLR